MLVPDAPTLATAFGVALALVAVGRRCARVDTPVLSHCNAQIAKLLPSLLTLRQGYRPPLIFPNGLMQSSLAETLPPPPDATPYIRETIELPALQGMSKSRCCPDIVPSGVVSIDWLNQADSAAPICLLVPGLTGSSSSQYIRRAAVELHRAGLRVGAYNPRGRGGNPLISPFFYSAGYTEDLRRVIRRIRDAFPDARLTAAGYSLGASYLGKYLGEEGAASELSGAVLFACPTDLVTSVFKGLGNSAGSRLVDRYVLVPSVQKVLSAFLPALEQNTPAGVDLDAAASATSMAGFDGATIAPMMGCESAVQYYTEASCGDLLHCVRTPMLVVNARNDPIASADHVDCSPFLGQLAAPLALCVTDEGGHSLGWPEGWRGTGRAWSVDVLREFVELVSTSAGGGAKGVLADEEVAVANEKLALL